MLKERAIIERSTKDFIINFIIALRYIRIETKFNRNEVNEIILYLDSLSHKTQKISK